MVNEFKAPIGLSWLFSIFKGIVGSIKRIHIRYEDDLMASRPISFGFMIDEIELTNTDSHWVFQMPNGMKFNRQKNKYVNKEFNIARVRVYSNS